MCLAVGNDHVDGRARLARAAHAAVWLLESGRFRHVRRYFSTHEAQAHAAGYPPTVRFFGGLEQR
jgi:hypothetical protein